MLVRSLRVLRVTSSKSRDQVAVIIVSLLNPKEIAFAHYKKDLVMPNCQNFWCDLQYIAYGSA
jgi:hypothetical protein